MILTKDGVTMDIQEKSDIERFLAIGFQEVKEPDPKPALEKSEPINEPKTTQAPKVKRGK